MYSELCIKKETDMKYGFTQQYAVRPKTKINDDILNSIEMTKACKEAYEKLSEGDDKPFFFVQELKFGDKYPATDGTIFTKDFMQSYISKLEEKPIPGSAFGHVANEKNWTGERASNEVYLVGAKIINDDTAQLKMYVSKDMVEHEYAKLKKEIQAGLLSTSIYSYAKFEISEEGDVTSMKAVESMSGERNDIVEWNMTGMHSGMIATSQKAVVEDNKNEGDTIMELEKAIEVITTSAQKVGSDKAQLAEKLGLGDIIATDEMKEKVSKFDTLSQKYGELETVLADMETFQKDNFEVVRDVALKEAYSSEEAIMFAKDLIGDEPMTKEQIKQKIEDINKMPTMQKVLSGALNGRQVDTGTEDKDSSGKVFIW